MLKSDNLAKLQPMYPLLIQQFVDDYNLSEGIAVDIGVGPGFLGLEMAKITNMKIVFIDISQKALDQAKNTFNSLDLDNEAEFINADVQALPLEDNYANFIMSRGFHLVLERTGKRTAGNLQDFKTRRCCGSWWRTGKVSS